MKPFDYLSENEAQQQRRTSHPGEAPAQPVQNQERLHDRSLSTESSRAWMHWKYSSEEWALFERIDWRSINLIFWLLASLSILLCSDIGLIIWSSLAGNYPALALSIVLIFVWTLVLIIFTSYTANYTEARKRHRSRQRGQSQTVTFDSKGLWEAGTYFPLNDLYFSLKRVSMTSEPPVLHFYQTSHLGGKTRSHSNTLHIPVPGGHEREAAELVQRFQTEVIQAREQTWQRMINRPEPDERGL